MLALWDQLCADPFQAGSVHGEPLSYPLRHGNCRPAASVVEPVLLSSGPGLTGRGR